MSDDTGGGGNLPAPGPTPGAGAAPAGPRVEWSPTDAVSYGIAAIKKSPEIILVVAVAFLIMEAIPTVNSVLQIGLAGSPDDTARIIGGLLNVVLSLAGVVVQVYVTMGLTRYVLKVLRGQPGALSDLFGPGPFLQMLVAVILGGIVTLIGCCLLCVPGVIVALGIMFYAYLLIDKELDGIEALKQSWELTKGHKGELFIFALLAMLLSLLGLLLCVVGIFLTNAILAIAVGWIYMRLTGQDVVDMAA